MQNTNDTEAQEESSEASHPDSRRDTVPERSDGDAPAPSDPDSRRDTAGTPDELLPEHLGHGDGHAAIPERPSIESDGSVEIDRLSPEDFEAETLQQCLRTMMTSRRLDEKMMTLLKQGEGHFHIGCAGHEAAQSALSLYSRPGEGPGHDWFCLYYRDLCMALSLGMTPKEALLAHLAKADDPNSGGARCRSTSA